MKIKKIYLALIVIQSLYAGMFILSKAAFNEGMSTFVFAFYRQFLATIFLIPLALIFERKTAPPLLFTTFFKMFLLALIGITASFNIYGLALNHTSAMLASATTNMIPVIIFFFSILLRIETVSLKRASGIAKLSGVALCAGGAITIAFYKGPFLRSFNHHHVSIQHNSSPTRAATANPTREWIEGTFLMILSNTTWSIYLVLQGNVMKHYPSKLLFTALQSLSSAVQSFFVALIFERDLSRWRIELDISLLAVAYSGIVISGVAFYLQNWCIEKRGPVFLAMSTPLALVMTIVVSSVALGEVITLGSVLGGVLMVGGLYGFLWGKSKEQKDLRLVVHDNKESIKEKEKEASVSQAL